jgi:hypothetical protein
MDRRYAARLLAAAGFSAGLLVAGCGNSSPARESAGHPASHVTATPSVTPAATPTVPAATVPAGTGPAGPSACQSKMLKVTLGKGSAAAGTVYYQILFTNVSGTACTMYGFPGVSFTGETYAVQVGPAATRNHSSQEAVVTLAPGAVASAQISVVDAQNYPAGSCGLTTASGILVYPPNLTASVGLPFNGYTCANAKDHVLTVNAVVAGPGSS